MLEVERDSVERGCVTSVYLSSTLRALGDGSYSQVDWSFCLMRSRASGESL